MLFSFKYNYSAYKYSVFSGYTVGLEKQFNYLHTSSSHSQEKNEITIAVNMSRLPS